MTIATAPTAPTGAAATPPDAARLSSADTATGALSSDFETFLKMLTVQMQNQDPLNPVDSSDFASQLAAFSSVEQQVQTNDLLSGLSGQMGLLGLGQLQGWVGMAAWAEMPVVFDGTSVELEYETASATDMAQLVVRDSAGGIVQQRAVPPGGGRIVWDGADETGQLLLPGTYELSIDAFHGEEHLATEPVVSQARVVEARLDGGNTVLVMAGGQHVPAASVIALRRSDEN